MEYLVGERQVIFEIPVLTSQRIQQLRGSDTTKALMMMKNATVFFHQCRYQEGVTQIRYNQEVSKDLNSDYIVPTK